MTWGTAGMLNGEDENSRITGINGGEVSITDTLNAPAALNPGNMGAVITSSQNLGVTTIERGHFPQTALGESGVSIHRYFDIAPASNAGLNATLRIYYFDAEKNALDENNFVLWKSPDNVTWTDMGQSSRDAIANYVEQPGLDDFSRWTLSLMGALPVTGMELAGIWKNNAAYLNWITLTEYRNSHFTIQRKYEDEFDFRAIGREHSAHADGNARSATKYVWKDVADNNKGAIQYRLQQHDIDGRATYSNVIVLKPKSSLLFIEKMFPTIVVKHQVYIRTGNRNIEKMQVSIYDMKGRLIMKKELNYQSQWLNLPQISAGNYKMFIRSGAYHWEGSFVKE